MTSIFIYKLYIYLERLFKFLSWVTRSKRTGILDINGNQVFIGDEVIYHRHWLGDRSHDCSKFCPKLKVEFNDWGLPVIETYSINIALCRLEKI